MKRLAERIRFVVGAGDVEASFVNGSRRKIRKLYEFHIPISAVGSRSAFLQGKPAHTLILAVACRVPEIE
jgi:hypothetical protein